jgi:hypothetical protein
MNRPGMWLAAAVLLCAGNPGSAADLPPAAAAGTREDRLTETWASYSMMGKRGAGRIWSDGRVVSQFEWRPRGKDEWEIRWGDPANWPAGNGERFIRAGDWVMLDGWWGNGTYYSLRVTKDELCDERCGHCTTIATNGPQHYAKWRIHPTAYCLRANGTITEESSGKVLRFEHVQVYSPPAPCNNTYHTGRRCIRQWESWSDDRLTPFGKKLEREQLLAKGLGEGFTIRQWFPTPWQAELRDYSGE